MSDVMTELAKEASDKAMEVARLKADNDRLRELVRDMWRDRDALSYGAAIPTLKRMRELGVEVDA